MLLINNNAKILITGANGLLGSAFLNILKKRNYTNVFSPNRKELNLLEKNEVASYIEKIKPDYVFHFAAVVFGLAGNISNQYEVLENNTTIDINLFSSLQKHLPQKIFYASTVAGYAYPYLNLPLKEEDFFKGFPHYGEFGYASAKRYAYNYLHILKNEFNIDFYYGLLTNLFGPNDRFDEVNGHVIPSLIKRIHSCKIQNKPLEIWGDGKASRDFMFSVDAANAIYHSFLNLEGIVNISTGKTTSMKELAELLCSITEFNNGIIWNKNKPVGISERSVNNFKITPFYNNDVASLKDALEKTYNWYAQNQNKT